MRVQPMCQLFFIFVSQRILQNSFTDGVANPSDGASIKNYIVKNNGALSGYPGSSYLLAQKFELNWTVIGNMDKVTRVPFLLSPPSLLQSEMFGKNLSNGGGNTFYFLLRLGNKRRGSRWSFSDPFQPSHSAFCSCHLKQNAMSILDFQFPTLYWNKLTFNTEQ